MIRLPRTLTPDELRLVCDALRREAERARATRSSMESVPSPATLAELRDKQRHALVAREGALEQLAREMSTADVTINQRGE